MKRLLVWLSFVPVVALMISCGSSRVGYPCRAGESSAITGCAGRGAAPSSNGAGAWSVHPGRAVSTPGSPG